jgi:hypothetical protein
MELNIHVHKTGLNFFVDICENFYSFYKCAKSFYKKLLHSQINTCKKHIHEKVWNIAD